MFNIPFCGSNNLEYLACISCRDKKSSTLGEKSDACDPASLPRRLSSSYLHSSRCEGIIIDVARASTLSGNSK